MAFVRLSAVLIALVWFGISFAEEVLTLRPGGKVVGVDGITIDADRANLSEAVTVFLERIEEADLPAPLPDYVTPVGGVYRYGSPDDVFVHPGLLTITVPLPPNLEVGELSVYAYIPSQIGDGPGIWLGASASYFPATHEAAFTRGTLLLEGAYFTIGNRQ